jgi:hypothetical protein
VHYDSSKRCDNKGSISLCLVFMDKLESVLKTNL